MENEKVQEHNLENMPIDALRDLGISLWESGIAANNPEKKKDGVTCLFRAYKYGDIEAAAWIGTFIFHGILRPSTGDAREIAINILYNAASMGSSFARTNLNKLCRESYEKLISNQLQNRGSDNKPLSDFDGKKIVIDKSGKRVPIDAKLEYVNGMNILSFSLNLCFLDEEVPDPIAFEEAVINGIKEWEGTYEVFGGQSLQVKVNITNDLRFIDNVMVVAVTEKYRELFKNTADIIKTKKGEKTVNDLLNDKRSMAYVGFKKWSTKSKKVICITSKDETFKDYYEIRNVAKHEFGHALGLGDLYRNTADQLNGVEKGTYAELDGFYLRDYEYNLVMSDHHGPISNNDIEMVVLAFSEDKMQLYQKEPHIKLEISKALGKGN